MQAIIQVGHSVIFSTIQSVFKLDQLVEVWGIQFQLLFLLRLFIPKKKIISFVGDGGFLMSGLEISTAVENKLNIIFIIINNSSYGTIRMHQENIIPKELLEQI